jgi:PKD repeat protein
VNGSNVTFSWDFGDGSSANGPIVSHVYAAKGEYTATVTASNNTNTLMETTTAMIVEEPIEYYLYIPIMYQYPELR